MFQNALAIYFTADEKCGPINPVIVQYVPSARDAGADHIQVRPTDEPASLPTLPSHNFTSPPAQASLTAPGKPVFCIIYILFFQSEVGVCMRYKNVYFSCVCACAHINSLWLHTSLWVTLLHGVCGIRIIYYCANSDTSVCFCWNYSCSCLSRVS